MCRTPRLARCERNLLVKMRGFNLSTTTSLSDLTCGAVAAYTSCSRCVRVVAVFWPPTVAAGLPSPPAAAPAAGFPSPPLFVLTASLRSFAAASAFLRPALGGLCAQRRFLQLLPQRAHFTNITTDDTTKTKYRYR